MQAHEAGRLDHAIALVCKAVLWLTTATIFVILCANTALRYVTGTSLQWANEVPELLFPWLVMAGVVLAAQQGAHIATTFLVEALPARARRGVAVAGWLLVAGLYGTLAVATLAHAVVGSRRKVADPRQMPGSITYACVMVGMVLLAVLALQSAWRAWHDAAGCDGGSRERGRGASRAGGALVMARCTEVTHHEHARPFPRAHPAAAQRGVTFQ